MLGGPVLRLLLSPCLGDCTTIGRRKPFRSILSTGASSGIGAALAEAYAEQEGMRRVLVARRAQKLRAVAAACEAKGATVDVMEMALEMIDVIESGMQHEVG